MSTIAVTFADPAHYPYARSKIESERIVRESGLDWAIVRPTIVLGPESPLWSKFRSLAAAPAMIVFGNGRTRVNPVHVDDVAAVLADLADSESLGERVVEVGGPDVLSLEEMLTRIRRGAGRGAGPVVRVPVGPILGTLSILERFLMPVLPVAAGQFYAFARDSVASPGPGVRPAPAERIRFDAMVEEASSPSAAPTLPENDDVLDRECDTLTRYLIGEAAPPAIREKYRQAHAPGSQSPGSPDGLCHLARRGPRFARIADTFAVVFARRSPLRRKLVLLLALLESHGETSARVDTPDAGSPAGFVFAAGLRALVFLVVLALSLVFVPLGGVLGGRR